MNIINKKMRNAIYIILLFVLLLPFNAFGYSYTRDPAGLTGPNPLNVSVTLDNASEIDGWTDDPYYCVAVFAQPANELLDAIEFSSDPYPIATLSSNENFTLSNGDGVNEIAVISVASEDCTDLNNNAGQGWLTLESGTDPYIVTILVEGGDALLFIEQASDDFGEAYGFTIDELTDWTGGKILLVAGSGLALFDALLPFILGLALIAGIVYIVYRAFLLFRH